MASKVAGRRVRDEGEARAALAELGASGLSLGEWARQRGLQGRSLHAWRLILDHKRKGRSPRSDVRFVEFLAPVPPQPKIEPVYVIHVGALRVDVRGDFDADVLRRLVAVVASC